MDPVYKSSVNMRRHVGGEGLTERKVESLSELGSWTSSAAPSKMMEATKGDQNKADSVRGLLIA